MVPEIIHETILKDITDLIGDARDLANDGEKMLGKKPNTFKSLTQNANKLILVFPVLCTKGISTETASIITKAIEKNCVNLLELLFASIQLNDTENLNDYISKFHSNISIGDKITVDDFIGFTKTLESAVDTGDIKVTDRVVYESFKNGMKEFSNVAKTSLNEHSLSDFVCRKTTSGYETILEAGHDRRYNKNDTTSDKINAFVEKMSENDIKKANELMPTKIVVNFYDKEHGQTFKNAIIGVKCKLYPVDSMEIIERISSKYADTNWMRELVRASTGEISFWRDFVFALDRARVDALNSARKGSSAKMWKVLERRATKNRLSKWKANRADSSPITTLVVSQDELEYLKKEYDINLENRNIALKLMEEYNFMGIVIVDEPAESASFIWDEGNDAHYETLSFRNLERESNDKDFRKVISLMTKISR